MTQEDLNADDKNDIIVNVRLPYKDYKVLRGLIEERQAMVGVKKWISGTIFWLAGGLLSVLGLFAYFKTLGAGG